jgi:hypothetical protein
VTGVAAVLFINAGPGPAWSRNRDRFRATWRAAGRRLGPSQLNAFGSDDRHASDGKECRPGGSRDDGLEVEKVPTSYLSVNHNASGAAGIENFNGMRYTGRTGATDTLWRLWKRKPEFVGNEPEKEGARGVPDRSQVLTNLT